MYMYLTQSLLHVLYNYTQYTITVSVHVTWIVITLAIKTVFIEMWSVYTGENTWL